MSPDRSTAHQPDPDGPDGGREPSMRAVVQDRYGSAGVRRLSRVPLPKPGDDEVLVRVHAAGVDRGT